MPLGDYGDYLTKLNIVQALVLAAIGVVVALAAYRFLQAAIDDILQSLPQLGERFTRANRSRHAANGPEWVCRDCRSINAPNATWCYHGCGSRYRQEDMRIDRGTSFEDDYIGRRFDA